MDEFARRAHDLLGLLTNRADAAWHPGQLEAITALAYDRKRVLVVQRTGWGKSAVYFIATRLLRDGGSGPTILVSPLLALMRNQIHAAARMGVRAATINSANSAEWDEVVARVAADQVDILLISPERLANKDFQERVLSRVGASAGLLVVDEAHCISDWGHDFRPDYRRVKRVLDLLPRTVPVLGCTATANSRVVSDVAAQLGPELSVFRGGLGREGLILQVANLPSQADRLAWLAATIPKLPGTGIVYCLTKGDVALVTDWLAVKGIDAQGYTGQSADREEVEEGLLDNQLKVVVATSALGMGFDKPDLAFVIHYQAPGSVITYYQQVGRAGRQLDTSIGVLLRGSEDARIQDWFITSAFPTAEECRQVLSMLESRDGFVKLSEIGRAVNVRPSRIENLVKNLEVDGIVVANGKKYQRTPRRFTFDSERADAITALRRSEQEDMLRYGTLESGCRMAFLIEALDDPTAAKCGICDLCVGPALATAVDPGLALEASSFVRRRPVEIEPRKKWPDNLAIPVGWQMEVGRALCRWGDGGWGDLVRRGKQVDGRFDDRLVEALRDLVIQWMPRPGDGWWVAWVPSLDHPSLVPDLAKRLATSLGLTGIEAIIKTGPHEPQKGMQNSSQQLANIQGAFAVAAEIPAGPALLVDDIVDSRWTMTYIGSLLRQAGCSSVTPLALADNGGS
jgi:ATP-dependent DNA helicase RecQ